MPKQEKEGKSWSCLRRLKKKKKDSLDTTHFHGRNGQQSCNDR